jgi:hypothetical protein
MGTFHAGGPAAFDLHDGGVLAAGLGTQHPGRRGAALLDHLPDDGLGAVMGMDWHSSGITTSVIGALKRGLGPLSDDLGIHVCGGRGQHSRKTPDRRAEVSRARQLDLLADLGPDRIVGELAALRGETPAQALLPHLIMPAHHDVRSSDVFTRRLHGTLAAAAERGPADFPDLLLTPGVGARTVRSLAMVAEVVHGAPYRFRDPARFSLAHGGKDRHPYPVPIKVYEETIRVMKSAVQNARFGRDEAMQALKRLDVQARRLERTARDPHWTPSSQPSAQRRRCWMAGPYSDGKTI